MTKALDRRVANLEHPPGDDLQMVYFIHGPHDMDAETALALLRCAPAPDDAVIYMAILPLGERPRHGPDPSPITDAEWAAVKDSYPRKAGWWNDWNGLGAEKGVALARAEAAAETAAREVEADTAVVDAAPAEG